ncbi:hypothetical protein ACRYKO_22265 [Escherichia coli]|nr:hypothetical protein [Escherichia coli]
MSAFIKLASVLALFISPVVVAIAGEQSHCTKINEYPSSSLNATTEL